MSLRQPRVELFDELVEDFLVDIAECLDVRLKLVQIAEEELEGHVLLKTYLLHVAELLHVVNAVDVLVVLVEGHDDEQRLRKVRHIDLLDPFFFLRVDVLRKLMVPECDLKLVPQGHDVLECNFLTIGEELFGQSLAGDLEVLLDHLDMAGVKRSLSFLQLLAQLGGLAVRVERLGKLFLNHFAVLFRLENIFQHVDRHLLDGDEEQEFGKVDCFISVRVGNAHNFIDIVAVLLDVGFSPLIGLDLAVVERGECAQEVNVTHFESAIGLLFGREHFEYLLRRAEETNLIFIVAADAVGVLQRLCWLFFARLRKHISGAG